MNIELYGAVDSDGCEYLYNFKPTRTEGFLSVWGDIGLKKDSYRRFMLVPTGTIHKMCGKNLTFREEPIKI
jgi:hypothetical protein